MSFLKSILQNGFIAGFLAGFSIDTIFLDKTFSQDPKTFLNAGSIAGGMLAVPAGIATWLMPLNSKFVIPTVCYAWFVYRQASPLLPNYQHRLTVEREFNIPYLLHYSFKWKGPQNSHLKVSTSKPAETEKQNPGAISVQTSKKTTGSSSK